ncbi:uncharacterized protein ASCRUDRAFT_77085 [Ascoidea rubescens DSM 1968]|uniref:Uncharacterized protein n=1 Tax=Ascoidea rubescens DSM 1968 TaxID=1344418 RepID=A0A1D2VCI5_9ASCO|nr:hypothetical protein ASCRUDRAFT_77085 [Ascoidea rubescens DSM 1968]ODV59329.1 hypothetical protein ASCRUDRAFT_77085 [Ascoidea rubescens DSM 1968]
MVAKSKLAASPLALKKFHPLLKDRYIQKSNIGRMNKTNRITNHYVSPSDKMNASPCSKQLLYHKQRIFKNNAKQFSGLKRLLNLELEDDTPKDSKIIEIIKNEDTFSVLDSLKALKVSCDPNNSEEMESDTSILENSMIGEAEMKNILEEKSLATPAQARE